MNLFGRILFRLYAIRVYRDGDGLGYVWVWWHPLAWVLAPFILFVHMLANGVVPAWRYRYDAGWQIAPYFKLRPDKLEWISRG